MAWWVLCNSSSLPFSISDSLVSLFEGASGVMHDAAAPPGVTDSLEMNSDAIFEVSRTVEGSDPGEEWMPGMTHGLQVLVKLCFPMGHFGSFVVGTVGTVGTPWMAVDELVALVVITEEFEGYMGVNTFHVYCAGAASSEAF